MALHAHKAHTLPLLSNTHFSQARLVSFLTITVSPSLLAGVSTASVSFQQNCTTVKVKGTFLFSVSYSEWWGRLGMRGGGGEVQYQQMQLWNRTFGCRRGSRKPFCQSSKSIFSIIFFWKKKRSRETPWVPLLLPDVDPEDMAQNGMIRCHECPLWLWISLAIAFTGFQSLVWGEAVNSYPSHLFFARKAWGGLFALHRCYNKAVVFFPFLADCLCLAACFDGCKTNKIRPSSPTESDSWEENPMKGCRGNEQRKSRVGSRWLSWEHTANSVKKAGGWGGQDLDYLCCSLWPAQL